MNTCYSYTSPTQAMHVANIYQYDAAAATFKPVPGAGGVSAAPSDLEGRYAQGWAENIWADSLAL
jgi:sulfite dehydrogenase